MKLLDENGRRFGQIEQQEEDSGAQGAHPTAINGDPIVAAADARDN